MPLPPPDPKELGHYFALAQVGLEMVAFIGIGLALDYYLSWSPWGVVGGAVFGLVAGLAHLVALTNRQEAERKNKQRET
jgi:F0F1-type ATP synthase assembly protein I